VDSFLGQRCSSEQEAFTNMNTEFMALWNGFLTGQATRVTVLAATNRPEELDKEILCHLSRVFEVGLPNRMQRDKILEVILKGENVEDDIDYDHITSLCEGYSGSDLTDLCKQTT
jgi:SpoVK/Ycf46/Vps4 family AAA+-type ATPase